MHPLQSAKYTPAHARALRRRDKGKPAVRRGRKATGLPYERQPGCRTAVGVPGPRENPTLTQRKVWGMTSYRVSSYCQECCVTGRRSQPLFLPSHQRRIARVRKTVLLLALVVLAVLFASGAALLSLEVGEVSAQAGPKPNIIFVLTDDQFPGSENEMTALKSNVIDQGVKFTNMTSTFPLCCPGRATIQRGQYAHNTQIYGNSPPAGGWEKFQARGLHRSTVATWLDDRGYQTGLFGKYMNNYRDRLIPPGWDRWYAWNGVDEGWSSVNDQGNEKPLDRQEADSLVAREALGFLSTRLDNAAPVFAFVNFGAMHEPYPYAQVDADKFEGENVPRTPAFNEDDVSDKPDYVSKLPKLSDSEISALDQGYRNGLRSLMRVDRFIGDAFDLLRRKGEMDNTYFIFYTDNGAHFGQHRFEHGKLQPYEEDVNFPLFTRGPNIPHGVVKRGLVGNHDIAPTLADIVGADVPNFVDGRSFLPLAQ